MNVTKVAILSTTVVLLGACGGGVKKAAGPDLGQVLDRTVAAIEYFDAENIDAPTDDASGEAAMEKFGDLTHYAMNSEPKFYKKPVGISIREDAVIVGFADNNGDNVKDASETNIFTVEIDQANSRLIATDTVSGTATTHRASGTGLFAGYILGRMLGRQRSAGVKPSSMSQRKVTSRADYNKTRPKSRARSRARSGSSRAGK